MSDATPRQIALLEAEDPRFHVIAPMGTGLGMVATTEITQHGILSFALPSAPAMFLNIARNAHVARKATKVFDAFIKHPPPIGVWPENHTPVFEYFEQFTTEAIFAFAAVEAYVNESIPDGFEFTHKGKTYPKPDIERHLSIEVKLKKVLPEAHGCKQPKHLTLKSFFKLKDVRDRLVHLKSADRKSTGPEVQTIWGLLLNMKDANFYRDAACVVGDFPMSQERRWFQPHKQALQT